MTSAPPFLSLHTFVIWWELTICVLLNFLTISLAGLYIYFRVLILPLNFSVILFTLSNINSHLHAKLKKTKGTIPVAFSPLKHQHKAPETCNFSQKLNQEAQTFQHNHLKLQDPKNHNFQKKIIKFRPKTQEFSINILKPVSIFSTSVKNSTRKLKKKSQ